MDLISRSIMSIAMKVPRAMLGGDANNLVNNLAQQANQQRRSGKSQ